MKVEQTKSIRHQKYDYRLADGTPVPGVTTIVGLRAKPYLSDWGFRMGKEHPGLNRLGDYVDDLASIGSLAHHIITSDLKEEPPDVSDYTPNELAAAANCVKKWDVWKRGKIITVHMIEKQFVSEQYRYGGTPDVYAVIDGVFTVLDIKTGKRIYREHMIQAAAYAEGLIANGYPVEEIRVLQVGRNVEEGFSERATREWSAHWAWFRAMRQVYDIEKAIEKGEPWTAMTA